MSKKLWKSLVAIGLCSAAGAVSAAVLTLFDVAPGDEVKQTENRPCIFGDPSCQAPVGWTYKVFAANPVGNIYDHTGPGGAPENGQSYTIEQIRAVATNNFFIGIDVNTTSAASEVLDYFRVYDDGVLIFNYEDNGLIAQANQLANGTGWSDWFLKGIDLTSVAAGSIVRFDVRVTNVVDGREQFFFVPTTGGNPPPGEIPEPGSLALLGFGIVAAGLVRRRSSARK